LTASGSAPDPGGFFRGSELPRLLLLAGLLVAGWIAASVWVTSQPARDAREPAPQVHREPLPPADTSLELEGVVDRVPLSPRENPGYLMLLERARSTPPERLRAEARRDVLFSQLLENPARYRGIPIHVEGTALRVLAQSATGSRLFPEGEFFEAYVVTPDSQSYPMILVFEGAVPGLAVGDDLRVRVSFDGYFFKLMAYRAGDGMRFAPLLVGRMRWVDAGRPEPEGSGLNAWWILGIGGVLVFLAARRLAAMRHFFGAKRQLPRSRLPVTDEIEPEALSAWLEEEAEDPETGQNVSNGRSNRPEP
jgi:hypothetical protein